MTDKSEMAADLSPEDQERIIEALERMQNRQREGRYRPLPEDLSRMQSMAPWMKVVQEATKPPVPIEDFEERIEAARLRRIAREAAEREAAEQESADE